ncbi:hypothetical protein KY349_00095 [Candidatus Woesearchaeota archaeon]|jgi:hypothetical protein|nr:hypothetical protein [Candidatus Woesearchaeota archaeon]
MKNPIKTKKAQFYILTAIMLIAYATLLLQSENVTPGSSKAFSKAYDNFVFESSAAINNALFEQADVNQEYERFLDSFISYSKMKKLNVQVFSVLETGDMVYLSNKMPNPVEIINLNQTLPPDTNTYFARENLSNLVLEVRDDVFHENIYKFTISNQGTEAKAVLRIRKGANRQIFVMD